MFNYGSKTGTTLGYTSCLIFSCVLVGECAKAMPSSHQHMRQLSHSQIDSYTKLLGWRPSLLGWRPLLLGWRPSLLGRCAERPLKQSFLIFLSDSYTATHCWRLCWVQLRCSKPKVGSTRVDSPYQSVNDDDTVSFFWICLYQPLSSLSFTKEHRNTLEPINFRNLFL